MCISLELVQIWSSFLSILLCSKYLQSNFEFPGPLRSLSLGLIPTVIDGALLSQFLGRFWGKIHTPDPMESAHIL